MASSSTTPPMALTAHLNDPSSPEADDGYVPPTGTYLGRERTTLSAEAWDRIDRAVYREAKRTRTCAKFLPRHQVDAHITTVPSDTVLNSIGGTTLNTSPLITNPPPVMPALSASNPALLNTDEGIYTRLIEVWVEFSLTPSQLTQENNLTTSSQNEPSSSPQPSKRLHSHSTAATLAARAATIACQVEDTLLLQGLSAVPSATNTGSPLFNQGYAQIRGTPSDNGGRF